jgi:hypothetical protein
VFIIPADFLKEKRKGVKNRTDRLVLNGLAKDVIQEVRGMHPTYVFSNCGNPIYRIMGRAWKNARKRAELPMSESMT